MVYLIDTFGRYVGTIDGTTQEIIEQTPEGYTTTILVPPRQTDYWDGTNWVPIGAAPAYYFKYDYSIKRWVDTRKIENVRQEHWSKIKLDRNRLEFGGFMFKDNKYDSDQISQGRILAAAFFQKPVTWTLANDEVVELTVEDVNGLCMAMAMHIESVHAKARAARVLIYSAATIEEIESVQLL